MHSIPLRANGNLVMSRFAKMDPSGGNLAIQAGVGDRPVGIVQEYSHRPPYSTLDDGFAAVQGDEVTIYQIGSVCKIELGTTVSPGAYLAPDSLGRGIPATTGVPYGAYTAQGGTVGQIVECEVVVGTF